VAVRCKASQARRPECADHDFRLRIGLVEFDRSLNRATFSPRAGFDVEDGAITGLNGTVYFNFGLGVPWIDFPWSTLPGYFIAPGTFSAVDGTTHIRGTFEIRRALSEPGTLALLALWSFALLAAPAVRRRDDA
jgi:hypothetical protein